MLDQHNIWRSYVIKVTKAMINFRDGRGLNMDETWNIIEDHHKSINEDVVEFLVDTVSEIDGDLDNYNETIERLIASGKIDDFILYMDGP